MPQAPRLQGKNVARFIDETESGIRTQFDHDEPNAAEQGGAPEPQVLSRTRARAFLQHPSEQETPQRPPA
jgi:hypothetical protein